jgi:hypothetical protein
MILNTEDFSHTHMFFSRFSKQSGSGVPSFVQMAWMFLVYMYPVSKFKLL